MTGRRAAALDSEAKRNGHRFKLGLIQVVVGASIVPFALLNPFDRSWQDTLASCLMGTVLLISGIWMARR